MTADGDLSLLNQAELEARRDSWLKEAEISPDLCGTWYFTWNAFQIDCDVEGVLETIRDLDIQPQRLASGEVLSLPGLRGEGTLVLESEDAGGMHYRADMDVDPDDVREAEARTAVVTGEILHQSMTYEAALEKWQGATIQGTMHVILDADPAGQVWQRTVTREIDLVSPEGREEHRRTTQSVKRMAP